MQTSVWSARLGPGRELTGCTDCDGLSASVQGCVPLSGDQWGSDMEWDSATNHQRNLARSQAVFWTTQQIPASRQAAHW
eukprot:CAMPEP_0174384648 /NCGR_PEP_ID=MMETSP0811_2-20130205/126060_1 /TAXON_ID=73025 ORGANISM="Eutreptiella gymnastica-like, Strain CCMP1594" /NCGR_SAMPLE_ID=MMETSP0811_2 /ASSEMBLY_ACC=CAM_ASM_000667 /LENGTH=78 /DNA_ID=CAMNT_0015538673 /DNA_START=225 /DNA_END=458 /DNA_ORIENTATION=+